MTKNKFLPARESAFEWVQHAHKLYITARFLFVHGFYFNGVMMGSHALEIYLKAYLIYKTGKYEPGHDLAYYYKQCMQYDTFFCDDSLSKHFLPEKAPKVLMPELWSNYTPALRYPEPIPRRKTPEGFGVHSGSDTVGTLESLDCIAHFMYKEIPPDPKVKSVIVHIVTGETREEGNVIDDFLNGDVDHHSLGTSANAAELIKIFLQNNRYFPSP